MNASALANLPVPEPLGDAKESAVARHNFRAQGVLTGRQQMCLDFIRRSITQFGYPPTLREIGRHMGIRSTNGTNDHLRALERKGYICRMDHLSRGIQLVTDKPTEPVEATALEKTVATATSSLTDDIIVYRAILRRIVDATKGQRVNATLEIALGDAVVALNKRRQ